MSKETTYVTEPLDAEGYPDFAAWLNRTESSGVTPENNAAVPLVRAFGPDAVASEHREAFFEMLGIEPLPERGDYFVGYRNYAEKHPPTEEKLQETDEYGLPVRTAFGQMERARQGPWSREDCPLVAAWLAENEGPLALVAEGSRRARYYRPAIADGGFTAACFDGWIKDAARALNARAMLRLHEGKVDEAWDDLQTCHRLARCLGRIESSSQGFAANAIEVDACDGQCRFAHYARLSAEQAKRYRTELARLPPLPQLLEQKTFQDRLNYSIVACAFARHGLSADDFPGDRGETQILRDEIRRFRGRVDWDEVLRWGNSYYDRLATAARHPQLQERRKAVFALDMDLQALRVATATARCTGSSAPSREVASRLAAFVVMGFGGYQMLPIETRGDRAIVYRQVADIALALSAYRTKHGSYPRRLSSLRSQDPAALAKDPYRDDELRYRPLEDGYFLYSVGPNGEDDGGPTTWISQDDSYLMQSDDVGVRMGAAERPLSDAKTGLSSFSIPGQRLPTFSIPLLEPSGTAGTLTNAELAGKVAVIQCWAPSADSRTVEEAGAGLAKFEQLIDVYENADRPLIFASVRQDWYADRPIVYAEAQLLGRRNVLVAVDGDKSIAFGLGFRRNRLLSALLVVDRKGIIRVTTSGSAWDGRPLESLKLAIDALLEGREPPPFVPKPPGQ